MCRSMNLLEHSNRNVSIDLSRVQALVAQHRLYIASVRPAFEHQGCHRVLQFDATAGRHRLRRLTRASLVPLPPCPPASS